MPQGRPKKVTMSAATSAATVGYEAQLWQMADALGGSRIDGVQRPLIVLPPAALVAAFDSFATSVERRREEMISESRTLAALRDTLLPKLISGELRVKDAERFVAEVA
jgi:hypothetical protein